LNIKITAISGKIYNICGDKICTDQDRGFYNVYSYSDFDNYYIGIAKYRNRELLFSIYQNRIESIDYREENK